MVLPWFKRTHQRVGFDDMLTNNTNLREPVRPELGGFQRCDRSGWYGRVLVVRVEGFCNEDSWKRAYREINDFERQLVDAGGIVVRFWLQISPEEQLKRFEKRQDTPYKRWKLTPEDWRNREKWGRYDDAVEDMLLRTSTLDRAMDGGGIELQMVRPGEVPEDYRGCGQ